MRDLPTFKYHPDPISSGSLERRDITCICCGECSPYIYVGPVYSEADLEEKICPWCIGSGIAHEKFCAEFTDIDGIGGYDLTSGVRAEARDEIAFRTPGFNAWQQERWLVHCGDGQAFLGPAGKDEIEAYESLELLSSLQTDIGLNDEGFRAYLDKLSRTAPPTAYVFRCLHCGKYSGYSDF